MCRISTLIVPPRAVPYNIKFIHGFEASSSWNCDCPNILYVKEPIQKPKFFESDFLDISSVSGISSLENSPAQSPKPKIRKNVRFADDCGKELEHFCYIPTRRAHAKKLFTVMVQLDKVNDNVEEKMKILDENENIVKDEILVPEDITTPWKADFELPKDSSKKMFELLGKNVVTLSSFSIQEEPLVLSGNIWTMNFGQDKNVFIRFSTDSWKSYSERPATFQESSDAMYDVFSFNFDIPAPHDKLTKIDFCICYQVNGSSFIDSNNGKNYTISRNVAPVEPHVKTQLSRRDVFINRRNGKADAMRRLNEINWEKFESLDVKTDVKFSI